MPKVYKVEKAFLSTVSKEDKTPQEVQTKGGPMHKYMVQFENQPIPGWIGILKKPGNVVSEGDEMYGVIEENNWGKPSFTRMQLPQDGSIKLHTSQTEPSQSVSHTNSSVAQPTGTVDEKLDYLIALVEALAGSQSKQAPKDVAPTHEDIDDKPIDLSEIPF